MRILLDNNVPRLLTSNLTDHKADTAFQRDWHTLTNGELLDQAESDGYQLLITADQRIPYQQNLSRQSIAVLIITSNERQAVSNAVAIINDAVNSMAAGETRVLHIHATYIGDEDIDRLFDLASALHTNFYEDWYGAGRVLKPAVDFPVARAQRSSSPVRWILAKNSGENGPLRTPVRRVIIRFIAQLSPAEIPLSRAEQKRTTGVSTSSEKVPTNWPAIMSHHGECDIDPKRTKQTSGSQQPGSRAHDLGPGRRVDGSNFPPHPPHPGGLP